MHPMHLKTQPKRTTKPPSALEKSTAVENNRGTVSPNTEQEQPVLPMYNLGDIMDKLSILSMKIYFGDEASIAEHRYLERSLKSFNIDGKVVTNVIRLTLMNRMIWELESEIRNGGEGNLGLDEVGKRALKIRDFNKKRVEYKNLINQIVKSFTEAKVQHRSS